MDFVNAATKTGTGWKHAAASMTVAMLAATGHAQAPAEPHPTLLRELNRIREDGCDGRGAKVSLLRENSALSRAAQLMAGGRTMDEALKAVDYRAVRAAQIAVRGATGPSALARRTLGKSCSAVMHAELAEAGFYQRGAQTWVVLAAPFSPPAAAQADDIQARVLALVNEARAAKMQEQLSQAMASFQVGDDSSTFDEMREKIQRRSASAEARMDLATGGIESQIADIERESLNLQVEDLLSAYKQQMGVGNVAQPSVGGESEKTLGPSDRAKALE